MTLRLGWAVLLMLVLALGMQRVQAHASLASSQPQDGASLGVAPSELVLQFDEPVQPLQLRLVDASGRAVALGTTRVEGTTLRVGLGERVDRGTYLFSYRVTSADSHPTGASIAFSVGESAPRHRVQEPDLNAGLTQVVTVLRALRDIALLATAGAAFFMLFVAAFPGHRRICVASGLCAAVLSVASIGVQGASLLGTVDPLAAEAWAAVSRTSFAWSAGVAAAGSMAIAMASTWGRGRATQVLLGAGALACVASLPLTGHATTAHPRWAATVALGVHGVAAAFWFGSLLALETLLRRDGPQALAALQRFSSLAVGAVVALLAGGIGVAAVQLGSLTALTDSRYGRLILLKAGLLVMLIALAGFNRFKFMPSLSRGDAGAAGKLRQAIVAEIAILTLVLAATSVLVQTPPRSGLWSTTIDANGKHATLTLRPGTDGRAALCVALSTAGDGPLEAAAVTLEMSRPAAGVEPITRPLQRLAAGLYCYDGRELTMGSRWQIEIRARVDDFTQWRWSTDLETDIRDGR